jgi:hypothetical protein
MLVIRNGGLVPHRDLIRTMLNQLVLATVGNESGPKRLQTLREEEEHTHAYGLEG